MDNITGKRISRLRREKKMTQKEFAIKLGITKGMLSRIERGENSCPSAFLIYDIACMLGVTSDYLFGR